MATAFIWRWDEKEGFQDRRRPGSHGGWTVADRVDFPGVSWNWGSRIEVGLEPPLAIPGFCLHGQSYELC